jgi:TrkA domain protein
MNRTRGADTQARSRTGVSIVAVLRAQTAFPAPTPDSGFQAGDTAVVVGTPSRRPGAGQTPGRLIRFPVGLSAAYCIRSNGRHGA